MNLSRRQLLALLSGMLLTKARFEVNQEDNYRLIGLLLDASRTIG